MFNSFIYDLGIEAKLGSIIWRTEEYYLIMVTELNDLETRGNRNRMKFIK